MIEAYAAGFFDGEGNIDIRYRKTGGGKYQRFELRITVVQIDRRPLELMQDKWGGSIARRKQNTCSQWVASGRQAATFLHDVFDFLIVKREEAEVALAFYAFAASIEPKYRTGAEGKGFVPHSQEVIDKKVVYMETIRAIRAEGKVAPRSNRNTVQAA